MTRCKYFDRCDNNDSDSITCMKTGGEYYGPNQYCGKYKNFEKSNQTWVLKRISHHTRTRAGPTPIMVKTTPLNDDTHKCIKVAQTILYKKYNIEMSIPDIIADIIVEPEQVVKKILEKNNR